MPSPMGRIPGRPALWCTTRSSCWRSWRLDRQSPTYPSRLPGATRARTSPTGPSPGPAAAPCSWPGLRRQGPGPSQHSCARRLTTPRPRVTPSSPHSDRGRPSRGSRAFLSDRGLAVPVVEDAARDCRRLLLTAWMNIDSIGTSTQESVQVQRLHDGDSVEELTLPLHRAYADHTAAGRVVLSVTSDSVCRSPAAAIVSAERRCS